MLSSLLEDVIKSYDEIKETYHKAKAMLESVETLSNTSKTMLDESISTHHHIKTHLDEFEKVRLDEKLARFEIAFSKLPSLKQSFDKSEEDIKALLGQIVAKNAEFESTKTKLEQINTNFIATKDEAKTIIDNFYSQSAEVLNTINKALELYLASAEEIRLSEDTIRSHKEHIDQKVIECKTIKDEIVSMRERSQCLMNKAEEILSKIDGFNTTLDEYVAKIDMLESGYNEAFAKNEALAKNIEQTLVAVDELNKVLLGTSLEELILSIKNANDILNESLANKQATELIKEQLEQKLQEQDTKLSDFYTKAQIDEKLVSVDNSHLLNEEISRLETLITNLQTEKVSWSSFGTSVNKITQVGMNTLRDNLNKNELKLINDKITELENKTNDTTPKEPSAKEIALENLIISNTNEIFKMFNEKLKG